MNCINPKCDAEIKAKDKNWNDYAGKFLFKTGPQGKLFCEKCLKISIFTKMIIFNKYYKNKLNSSGYHFGDRFK